MKAMWIWIVMAMVVGNQAADFNVNRYGAKGDGKSDDSTVKLISSWIPLLIKIFVNETHFSYVNFLCRQS